MIELTDDLLRANATARTRIDSSLPLTSSHIFTACQNFVFAPTSIQGNLNINVSELLLAFAVPKHGLTFIYYPSMAVVGRIRCSMLRMIRGDGLPKSRHCWSQLDCGVQITMRRDPSGAASTLGFRPKLPWWYDCSLYTISVRQ